MSLGEKLVKLMADIPYLQKTGKNEHFRYRYATAADVLAHVQPMLVKHGLIAFPSYSVVSQERIDKSHFVLVKCILVIRDTEKPEQLQVETLGSGMDTGDKAVMKAMTAAHKYAWLHALNIATGDDPEADPDTDRSVAAGLAGAR